MIKVLQKILLMMLLIAGSMQFSKAALYTIETSDFQFSQPFDSILVGDTVKWVWINGSHTTTSNGIPFMALPWNVLLDKLHTSYQYVVSIAGTFDYISVPDAPQMGGEFVASWPTGISNPSMAVTNFNILGNPTRSNIQFHFTIAETNATEVSLFNILGTKVQTLYQGTISPGDFRESVSLPSAIAPGIYFVKLTLRSSPGNGLDAMLTRRIVIQ